VRDGFHIPEEIFPTPVCEAMFTKNDGNAPISKEVECGEEVVGGQKLPA